MPLEPVRTQPQVTDTVDRYFAIPAYLRGGDGLPGDKTLIRPGSGPTRVTIELGVGCPEVDIADLRQALKLAEEANR